MQAIRTLRGAAAPSHSNSRADHFVDEPAARHNTSTSSTSANHGNGHTTFSRIHSLAKLRLLSPPASPSPQPTLPRTLVQDGSYLQTLGLKLSESSSCALAPVLGGGSDSLKGRRPLPPGRGKALGALISTYVPFPPLPSFFLPIRSPM